MKWSVSVCALGVLAASLPALANTASDNIVWSARPVAKVSTQPECTAYSGRPIAATDNSNDTKTDPLAKMLKVAGTLAGVAAVAVTTKATSVEGPNPCRRF
jgi:hypothetical protein